MSVYKFQSEHCLLHLDQRRYRHGLRAGRVWPVLVSAAVRRAPSLTDRANAKPANAGHGTVILRAARRTLSR